MQLSIMDPGFLCKFQISGVLILQHSFQIQRQEYSSSHLYHQIPDMDSQIILWSCKIPWMESYLQKNMQNSIVHKQIETISNIQNYTMILSYSQILTNHVWRYSKPNTIHLLQNWNSSKPQRYVAQKYILYIFLLLSTSLRMPT